MLTGVNACREYLLKNGDELKQSLPAGTQLITEIRRNHHPELRANYGAAHLCTRYKDTHSLFLTTEYQISFSTIPSMPHTWL